MCPRPRKASDEEVFAAASRVMGRRGPARLRLADVAAEAGLTAGALVQRFGSRHGLLVALAERSARTTGEYFAGLRAAHASPLATLHAYADCFAGLADSPGALAHHLSYLQLDLTDPELHRHTAAQAHATRAALRDLLDEAVAAGELLPGVDTTGLARTLQVMLGGSLMAWAFYREGTPAAWVRHDLDAVLRPYTAPTSGGRASRRPRRTPRSDRSG
jgi:AcrR family transcriptional regulator